MKIGAVARKVGTRIQVVRGILRSTIISVLLAVPLTFLALVWVFGANFGATITVLDAVKFGLGFAALSPLLIVPLASYRTHMAIRERDRAHVELRRMAETDQLTGLLNRRGFDLAASRFFAADEPTRPISVLMLDVDFFKSINDRFGHDCGDAALVHVAAVLRDAGQPRGFILGRQGGEEFIALLPDMNEADAAMVAEHLRHAIASAPVVFRNHTIPMAVSIGTASRRPDTTSLSQLVREADTALYVAKASGRNCVVQHHAIPESARLNFTPMAPAGSLATPQI